MPSKKNKPARKWLIDAHNVIHQKPELYKLLKLNSRQAFTAFCLQIDELCVCTNKRAKIVFDGVPLELSGFSERLEIHFSRERTADEVIISIMAEDNAKDRWIVVTDDREIRHLAYFYSVDNLRTAPFLKKMYSTAATAVQNSKSRTKVLNKTTSRSNVSPKLSDPGQADNPTIPESEIEQLLRLFNKGK
ncbi:MAG: NYN domain-containing protein [Balneolales bacterium]|nr:NYN domain-containing protein [Balneolales bacterium]